MKQSIFLVVFVQFVFFSLVYCEGNKLAYHHNQNNVLEPRIVQSTKNLAVKKINYSLRAGEEFSGTIEYELENSSIHKESFCIRLPTQNIGLFPAQFNLKYQGKVYLSGQKVCSVIPKQNNFKMKIEIVPIGRLEYASDSPDLYDLEQNDITDSNGKKIKKIIFAFYQPTDQQFKRKLIFQVSKNFIPLDQSSFEKSNIRWNSKLYQFESEEINLAQLIKTDEEYSPAIENPSERLEYLDKILVIQIRDR